MRSGKAFIGTSGWSYAHWGKDRFYPKGLKQGEWLTYFAQRFMTVEINTTFYRMPRPEFVQRWRTVTSSGFRFAVKLWKRITHEKRLVDCGEVLRKFLEVAEGLGPRRGPLLIQLPPTLRRDPQRLDAFLDDLHHAAGRARWHIAVEFRHPSWIEDEVIEVLNRRHAALCLSDMPRCPVTEPNEAAMVYVRRHGPTGRYQGRYAPAHITADARRIRGWLKSGRDVYVYYNNDIGGHAVDNARQLAEALGVASTANRAEPVAAKR